MPEHAIPRNQWERRLLVPECATHVILGPPGCGKTTKLAELAGRAVTRYGESGVMVCSLTRVGARQAARAVDLPQNQVGTLHALAYHALGAPTVAEGKIKDWNENYKHWLIERESATIDEPYGHRHDPSPHMHTGDDLKMAMSAYRTRQLPRSDWPDDVRRFAEAWDDWKQQCGYVDFTDLLELALVNLDYAPGKPQVLMLDEAQDVGALEMAVLHKWSQHAEHFVLAGDYCQSLFQWRGSSPTVLTAIMDAGVKPHVLEQSYRVPRAVHTIAMRWMRRTHLPEVRYYPRDYEGTVAYNAATYKRGEGVLDALEGYVKHGKTVMLLTTCNYMLEPVLQVLQKHGLAYHNPWRPNNGRWNPLAPRRGTTFSERVLAFLRPDTAVWGEQAHFWTPQDLKTWASQLPAVNVFQPGQKSAVERCPEKMRDVELARAMRQWFTPEALERILTLDVAWYCTAAQQSKGGEISKPFIAAIVKHRGAAALREKPLITVGTVHSLKGYESAVVFVWPDIAPQAYYSDHAGHDEIARVFYVAVTRSREELVLCAAASPIAVQW